MLDTKDALKLSQSCSKFRSIIHSMPLKPFVTTNKELVYRWNCKKYRQEIHVLKIGRSINKIREKPFFAESLEDLSLPPHCIFNGAITFESNVDISAAFSEILQLSANGRISPEILRFNGGSFPKGSLPKRNIKKMGELELIEAFSKLGSLKEVHFLASRHFDFPTPPTTLLYLCDQLSHLSLVYDNIRFNLEDILLAVQFWRSISPLSATSNFHINSPRITNSSLELIEASHPFESDYDENDKLTELTFFHPSDDSLTLSFHFH
uniref:F-box domain-containing protein n=1 Tax=Panagrolaimus sp. ES5 TaxID=591445 RepID=A0AC34G1T4_9BILA